MSDPATAEIGVLSVWELTRSIRTLLESEVGSVWVEGEISNHRKQASGHQYFTLKDERSQLPCVLFRGNSGVGSNPTLADGLQVQLYGELTVYELRGQYQMIVQVVQGKGAGALQARFEALKRKLDAERLFDAERKKALPAFPTVVGLVTSPTGAALQDMLNILRRRAPWMRVIIHPVRVQGQGAAVEIAEAIADFNRRARMPGLESSEPRNDAVDLIVVARGGGSIEDLWEFNEEIVARAIAASDLPVVSAVGHEIDFTIADFAADLRAPTPSAAAELIAPDTFALLERLDSLSQFLQRELEDRIERCRERLSVFSSGALEKEPHRRLREIRQQLDAVREAFARARADGIRSTRSRLEEQTVRLRLSGPTKSLSLRAQQVGAHREKLSLLLCCQQDRVAAQLDRAASLLRVLGPQATLERGYTITLDQNGQLLRSVVDCSRGQQIITRWQDGEKRSTITE